MERLAKFAASWLLAGACAAHADSYRSHPDAIALVEELVAEEGFERAPLLDLLGGARRKDAILEAISRPAEKTRAWHEYRDIFVTEQRASQGESFYRANMASLQRVEREFGVPAELIVAIIGVETRYGRNMGAFRVLDALATLAFDYPRRAAFFRRELKHFLILSREQGLPAAELFGSYAGAMGYGQFMPSSYRSYAVDFDGDELADIWGNPVDAIGSVANYIRTHGWRAGEPVVSRAAAQPGYRQGLVNSGLKPARKVREFVAAGIVPLRSLPPEALATVMELEGEAGTEHWFGLHNFYVITRYNHSAMYALSVYQLSQSIDARMRR